MTEAQTGIFMLLVISVVVAFFAHALIRKFFLSFLVACIASAIIASVLFQVAAYLHIGYLDPFFPIAMVISCAIAFGIAAAVGLVVRMYEGQY